MSDSFGNSALHAAVRSGELQAISRLLGGDGGVGVDVNSVNDTGMTPLHLACLHNHVEALAALVEHGADAAVRDASGESPVMLLCQRLPLPELTAAVRVLLGCRGGAGILSQTNAAGETALHYAVAAGLQSQAVELVQLGASLTAAAADGKSPVNLATPELARALRAAKVARSEPTAQVPVPVPVLVPVPPPVLAPMLATAPAAAALEEPEGWACPTCTYENAADSPFCSMCDLSRPLPDSEFVHCDLCDKECTLEFYTSSQEGSFDVCCSCWKTHRSVIAHSKYRKQTAKSKGAMAPSAQDGSGARDDARGASSSGSSSSSSEDEADDYRPNSAPQKASPAKRAKRSPAAAKAGSDALDGGNTESTTGVGLNFGLQPEPQKRKRSRKLGSSESGSADDVLTIRLSLVASPKTDPHKVRLSSSASVGELFDLAEDLHGTGVQLVFNAQKLKRGADDGRTVESAGFTSGQPNVVWLAKRKTQAQPRKKPRGAARAPTKSAGAAREEEQKEPEDPHAAAKAKIVAALGRALDGGERGEQRSREVAQEVFEFHAQLSAAKSKLRSLIGHLADPLNPELKAKVLSGAITAAQLCQMSSHDLANSQVQEERRQAEAKALEKSKAYKPAIGGAEWECPECLQPNEGELTILTPNLHRWATGEDDLDASATGKCSSCGKQVRLK